MSCFFAVAIEDIWREREAHSTRNQSQFKNKLLAISGVRPVGPTVRRLTTDQEIPGSNPGQDYHPQIFLVSLLSWFNNQMDRQP